MRAYFADSLLGLQNTTVASLNGASVLVVTEGSNTPVLFSVYTSETASTQANPLTADAQGKIEFWTALPQRVDLVINKTGYVTTRRTVNVVLPSDTPGLLATPAEINQLVSGIGASATASTITSLTNLMSTDTPTLGDTLVYDGTKYVPQAPSGGGSGIQVTPPITITSAELLNLHIVPKVLVAAQAGIIRPLVIVGVPGPGDPYSADSSLEGEVFWGAHGGATLGNALNMLGLTLTPALLQDFPVPLGLLDGDDSAQLVNQPLRLMTNTPLTGGTRPYAVTVAYLVV